MWDQAIGQQDFGSTIEQFQKPSHSVHITAGYRSSAGAGLTTERDLQGRMGGRRMVSTKALSSLYDIKPDTHHATKASPPFPAVSTQVERSARERTED